MTAPDFPLPAPPFEGDSRVVPAGRAIDWLREGWALFIAQPGVWLAMGALFFVIVIGVMIFPVVGELAAHWFVPVLSAGLMAAARRIEQGEEAHVADMFSAFSPKHAPVLRVGVLFMVGWLAIIAIGILIGWAATFGGSVQAAAGGGLLGTGIAVAGVLFAIVVVLVSSVPLLMAVWYAPALAYFHDMSARAAMRASFEAVARNGVAFLVYGLFILLILFFGALSLGLGLVVAAPVIACSIYVSYRDVFLGT